MTIKYCHRYYNFSDYAPRPSSDKFHYYNEKLLGNYYNGHCRFTPNFQTIKGDNIFLTMREFEDYWWNKFHSDGIEDPIPF